MSSSSRWAAMLLAFAVAQSALPAPASAQLGGLKRRAEQAARKAVEQELPFTPAEAPPFDDRVLEIDAGRLDALLAGLEAEITHVATAAAEYEAEASAYEAARLRYEKEREAWEACAAEFRAGEAEASAVNQARVEKVLEEMNDEEFERYVEDLARRGEALTRDLQAGKSDPLTDRALADYQREIQILTVEQQRRAMLVSNEAMVEQRRSATEDPRLAEACGERPREPTFTAAGPEGILAIRGADAAEMTGDQYAIMRERVLYWWEQDHRPERMGFTEAEIELLDARADRVEDVFKRMQKARVPF